MGCGGVEEGGGVGLELVPPSRESRFWACVASVEAEGEAALGASVVVGAGVVSSDTADWKRESSREVSFDAAAATAGGSVGGCSCAC